MKKTLIILILGLGVYFNSANAQLRVHTNLVAPLMLAGSSSQNGGLFLNVDIPSKANFKTVHQFGLVYQRLNLSRSTGINDKVLSERYLQKIGSRYTLKYYPHAEELTSLPSGYHFGFFTDVSYAYTRNFKLNQEIENLNNVGLSFDLGLHTGYTFQFKKIMIEINTGLGVRLLPRSFRYDTDGKGLAFFSDQELNTALLLSATHLSVNLGYQF